MPPLLDLTTFPFTTGDDQALAADTLAITSGAGSPFQGIRNDGTVDALAGDDLIAAALDGAVATTDPVEIIGIDNPGTTATGEGDDTVLASLDLSADPGAVVVARGILGTPSVSPEALIDTGSGKDLIGSEVRISGAADQVALSGLFAIEIDTGADADIVFGIASASGSAFSVGIGGQAGGFPAPSVFTGILTQDGDDIVLGQAESGTGILARIQTGAGHDLVVGRTLLSGTGIVGSFIETGEGDDMVFAESGGDAATHAATIITEGGNDVVIASAERSAGDGADLRHSVAVGGSVGFGESAGIITGSGDDLVVAQVTLRAGDNSQLSASGTGIRSVSGIPLGIGIGTGTGDDTVLEAVSLTAGANSVIDSAGIIRPSITTDDGDDIVVGSTTVRGGPSSDLAGNTGIRGAAAFGGIAFPIDTGEGDDLVLGRADIGGGAGSDLSDSEGIRAATITTGAGRDVVIGQSFISGKNPLAAFGDGLNGLTLDLGFQTIDTGSGDDVLVGIGAEIAVADPSDDTPDEDETSEGIEGYTVELGDGNDLVHARGATAGVKNVTINGGAGIDFFDLHSGTGTVDGGDDFDILALSGSIDDFAFAAESGGVRITDSGLPNDTDLLVLNVELFVFDDRTTAFDSLLV